MSPATMELSDVEIRMELFVARADELRSKRAVQSGLRHNVTVRLNPDHTGQVEERGPDSEEFDSFLVVFRKFILNDEPVFLSSMFNLCERNIADPDLKERLREARQVWREARRSGIGFEIDGRRLLPEQTANIWIQGRIFHDDAKAAIIDQVPPPFQALLKAQLMDFVIRTTDVILYTAAVLRKALAEGKITP